MDLPRSILRQRKIWDFSGTTILFFTTSTLHTVLPLMQRRLSFYEQVGLYRGQRADLNQCYSNCYGLSHPEENGATLWPVPGKRTLTTSSIDQRYSGSSPLVNQLSDYDLTETCGVSDGFHFQTDDICTPAELSVPYAVSSQHNLDPDIETRRTSPFFLQSHGLRVPFSQPHLHRLNGYDQRYHSHDEIMDNSSRQQCSQDNDVSMLPSTLVQPSLCFSDDKLTGPASPVGEK